MSNKISNEKNYYAEISKFIGEQKFGEAINYLQKIVEDGDKNKKAQALLEQVKKIVE